MENYYKIDKLSNSGLSHFKRSPLHFLHSKSDQAKKQQKTTAMTFGSAFHCIILEGDKFESQFVVEPICDRRTKEGKEIIKNFSEHNIGKEIITAHENELLSQMRDTIFAHEPSMELLNEIKETEKEIFWKDKITGIEMKGKLDGIGKNFILDLKTTTNAQPNYFATSVWNYDYHRQAALYIDGGKANGIDIGNFYFIAIEKEAPFGISVHRCSEELIAAGRKQYEELLEAYQYWKEIGSPAMGYEFRNPFYHFDLTPPSWYKQ